MEHAPIKKYFEAVGRRKTAAARVRIFPGKSESFLVNGREANVYFRTIEQRRIVQSPFGKAKPTGRFEVSVKVSGGGLEGQAEAVRHGIARALLLFDEELRKKLKKAGFLKRDPRAKERRKFGLKKARKAPQWSKR